MILDLRDLARRGWNGNVKRSFSSSLFYFSFDPARTKIRWLIHAQRRRRMNLISGPKCLSLRIGFNSCRLCFFRPLVSSSSYTPPRIFLQAIENWDGINKSKLSEGEKQTELERENGRREAFIRHSFFNAWSIEWLIKFRFYLRFLLLGVQCTIEIFRDT